MGGSTSPAEGADGGGVGRRKPSWRERENNRRRERRRRAIAAKIYAGLRAQGNYNLPKHCDNNEVLKALCAEAGWVVEPDGTTYRKGRKPMSIDVVGTSANITPSSSRNPSPRSSYFASPIPSYLPSSSSSYYPSPSRQNANNNHIATLLHSSSSCPVTPPLYSPSKPPQQSYNLETLATESMSLLNIPFSAPASPTRGQRLAPAPIPECDEMDTTATVAPGQWLNFLASSINTAPASPTFNLVKPVGKLDSTVDGASGEGKGKEFDFGNVALMAWEGERIHEEGMDDLELTL